MKTRLTLILLLAVFATFSAKAQNKLSVASFQLVEHDIEPILNEVKDQNGNTCALLKIQTSQMGFTFDVGSLGVTKTEQHTGEIWVYVPFGVRRISIHHQQLGHLNDYYFPCSIEKGRTYRMELISGTVTPIIDEDLGGNYLVLTLEPKNALVYIDEKLRPIEDSEVSFLLSYGKHTYRVEAPGFMNEAGIVEIGNERVEIPIRLVSAKATLTVTCTDADADIYINNQNKGRGSWTGQLAEGMYAVEAQKAGHRGVKQSITLAKQEQKTLTLDAPQPIYGKLNISSTPANCDVYLDGDKIGKSPNLFSNILVGSHTLELRKNGYESQIRQTSIEEGKRTDLAMTLQSTGFVAQQPEVQQAEPTPQPKQDEKPVTLTDKKKTFIMADFYFDENFCYGLTFGQVRKFGWYVNCHTGFDKYLPIGITGGAVFRCAKPFYLYVGAGGSYYHERIYLNVDKGIYLNVDIGCMFHFKHFSIRTGLNIPAGIQIGLGYNF